MKSIKLRLVIFFSIICIGSLIISGMGSMWVANSYMTDNKDDLKQSETEYFAELINGWMAQKTAVVDAGACYLSNLDTIEKEPVSAFLMQMTNSDSDIGNVYSGYDNMEFWECTGNIPEGFDVRVRQWYIDAEATEDKIYTAPYIDIATSSLVVTAAKHINRSDEWNGVIGMDLSINTLISLIESNSEEIFDDGSYIILTTAEGNIMYHENSDYMFQDDETCTNIADVIDGAYLTGIESGKKFLDYDGVYKFAKSTTVTSTGWQVIEVTPIKSYSKASNKMVNNMILSMIVIIILAGIIISIYSNSISKPIVAMEAEIIELRNLDLQEKEASSNAKRKDEIGQMEEAVLSLREELGNIVNKIKDVSVDLREEFESTEASVQTTVENNELIKETLSQINQAIGEVAGQTQEANENLTKFAEELNDVSGSTGGMNDAATKSIEGSLKGMESIVDLSTKIEETQEIQRLATESVNALADKSESIGGISKTISSIAEQTSLLALNASIEAARAGEAGRGFAVVAEEIGELANETTEATNGISALITEIQKEIENVDKKMVEMSSKTDLCRTAMDETKEIFDTINQDITEVGDAIGLVDKDIESLEGHKDKVVDKFADISSETEELSAASEDIFAKVDNQNEAIETIGVAMENLEGVIIKLNDIIDEFKL